MNPHKMNALVLLSLGIILNNIDLQVFKYNFSIVIKVTMMFYHQENYHLQTKKMLKNS